MQQPNEIKEIHQESSIELSKNSRGYTWTVKAYGSGNKEIRDNLEDLLIIAKTQVKNLEREEKENVDNNKPNV